MRDAIVDTESDWDDTISIQKMCMKKYMSQSSVYLLSVVTEGLKWVGTPKELRGRPDVLAVLFDPETKLWAVNSNFDQEWVEHASILPELRGVKKWHCISDYSTYHQRPRDLQRMYKTLTGKEVSKGARKSMKGVRIEELFSFEQDHMREYNLKDSDVGMESLQELRKLGPMSAMEERIAMHTRMMCRRGFAVDLDLVEQNRQQLEWIRFNQRKLLPWAGGADPELSPEAFNRWCCKQGVAPPANLRKTDADFTSWIQVNPKLAPVMKARQRFELANRKLSHIDKFIERVHEGTYYPDLLYCGAPHTRRFSAKGSSDGKQTDSDTHSGFNIQNMDRSPIFGDILTEYISPLAPMDRRTNKPKPGIFYRNFVVPRPGKILLILDFSQVEPRCLNWLAGNEKFLDLIRKGYALYEAFARSVGMWNEPGELKNGPVEFYTLIKNIVIGAGYGMSGKKFAKYANLPEEQAIREIEKFRKQAPMIPKFRYGLQKDIERAFLFQEPFELTMPNGETMWRFGLERFEVEDERGKRWGYRAQKVLGAPETMTGIYGAKMAENVTQRMARDVMSEAVVTCEDAGLPCILHAHDELILEVDRDNAKDALAYAKQIMTRTPDWCAGLPLGCSGGIYEQYTKD